MGKFAPNLIFVPLKDKTLKQLQGFRSLRAWTPLGAPPSPDPCVVNVRSAPAVTPPLSWRSLRLCTKADSGGRSRCRWSAIPRTLITSSTARRATARSAERRYFTGRFWRFACRWWGDTLYWNFTNHPYTILLVQRWGYVRETKKWEIY